MQNADLLVDDYDNDVFIHPSVSLSISGRRAGAAEVSVLCPYIIRLCNRNPHAAVAYRLTTQHPSWWQASRVCGILHPPNQMPSPHLNLNEENGKTDLMPCMAKIVLRVRDTGARREQCENNNNNSDVENSNVNGAKVVETRRAVDVLRIMFAELSASHPLLQQCPLWAKDFQLWWMRAIAAAAEERKGGVTIFPLAVKVLFMSEEDLLAALGVKRTVLQEELIQLQRKREKHWRTTSLSKSPLREEEEETVRVHLILALLGILCSFLAAAAL